MEIASVIKVICEHYVFYEDDDNMILAKFEEWLEETGIADIKNKGYNTMKYFKEILHMEESIAEEENREKVKKFQKSITYRWWNSNYGRIWENDEITDMIIMKIIEEKGFIEEYSDVEELISSDDTRESESP